MISYQNTDFLLTEEHHKKRYISNDRRKAAFVRHSDLDTSYHNTMYKNSLNSRT